MEAYLKLIERGEPKEAHKKSFLATGVGKEPRLNCVTDMGLQVISVACGMSWLVGVVDHGTRCTLVVHGSSRLHKVLLPGNGQPFSIPGLDGQVHVAAGMNHAVAWASGKLYSWGYNVNASTHGASVPPPTEICGQLGRDAAAKALPPGQVALTGNVVGAACGSSHTLVLVEDTVWAFGLNRSGQLGMAPAKCAFTPLPMVMPGTNGIGVVSVACGSHHSLFVTSAGQVYACGWNSSAQCGVPDNVPIVTPPSMVPALTDVRKVVAGTFHSLALLMDGRVLSWGGGHSGQLGRARHSGKCDPKPTRVKLGQQPVLDVSACLLGSGAVDLGGVAWIWGSLHGLNSASNSYEPRPLNVGASVPFFVNLSLGSNHVAVKTNDAVDDARGTLATVCSRSTVGQETTVLTASWYEKIPPLFTELQNTTLGALAAQGRPAVWLTQAVVVIKPTSPDAKVCTTTVEVRNLGAQPVMLAAQLLRRPDWCGAVLAPIPDQLLAPRGRCTLTISFSGCADLTPEQVAKHLRGLLAISCAGMADKEKVG